MGNVLRFDVLLVLMFHFGDFSTANFSQFQSHGFIVKNRKKSFELWGSSTHQYIIRWINKESFLKNDFTKIRPISASKYFIYFFFIF